MLNNERKEICKIRENDVIQGDWSRDKLKECYEEGANQLKIDNIYISLGEINAILDNEHIDNKNNCHLIERLKSLIKTVYSQVNRSELVSCLHLMIHNASIFNKICFNVEEEIRLKMRNLDSVIKALTGDNISSTNLNHHDKNTKNPTIADISTAYNNISFQTRPSQESINSGNANAHNLNEDKILILNDNLSPTISKLDKLINSVFHIACNIYPSRNNIGKYSWQDRIKKILKFKLKRINSKKKKPVLRKYIGRSKVASMKLRIKGRFVKNITPPKKRFFKIEG